MINDITLEHGENQHQNAHFENHSDMIDYEVSGNLTYSEISTIAKGLNLISEFYDVKAACSIKGNCFGAVALGQSSADAVQKILDSNPIDFISSIIILSSEADSETVKFFKDSNIVVATNFTNNAIEILNNHNVRYVTIKTPLKNYKKYLPEDIRITPLGTLIQSPNLSELEKDNFKVVSKQKPTVEQIEDAVFAWKVAKHVASQAVVLAKDLKTSAISQGLQSASTEFALNYSCERSKDSILASDMPLTEHDINVASQGRVGLIVIPEAGKEIITLADKYNICLITTAITNICY